MCWLFTVLLVLYFWEYAAFALQERWKSGKIFQSDRDQSGLWPVKATIPPSVELYLAVWFYSKRFLPFHVPTWKDWGRKFGSQWWHQWLSVAEGKNCNLFTCFFFLLKRNVYPQTLGWYKGRRGGQRSLDGVQSYFCCLVATPLPSHHPHGTRLVQSFSCKPNPNANPIISFFGKKRSAQVIFW